MQIKIDLKIFIFIAIFYITKQIEFYILIIIFACIHELGHMIAGILLGFRPEKIELMPLGLSISFKVNVNYYNKKIEQGTLLSLKKLIIASAGPLTNIIISLLLFFLDISWIPINRIYSLYINILIAVFNLIPIYPMDGGRIIKEIIHIKKGFKKSLLYTNSISNICIILLTAISSIGIYYLKNVAILFIILYLWCLVIIENKKYKTKIRIYNLILKNGVIGDVYK